MHLRKSLLGRGYSAAAPPATLSTSPWTHFLIQTLPLFPAQQLRGHLTSGVLSLCPHGAQSLGKGLSEGRGTWGALPQLLPSPQHIWRITGAHSQAAPQLHATSRVTAGRQGVLPAPWARPEAYMAVLARMEDSMACSSVRADGRLW